MKRLKLHWSARPLSFLLSAALILPALISLLAAAPAAHAQGVTRSAQRSFAVLDLVNRSGYGGGEIGRQAADSFVVELGKTNKYDVIPRSDTTAGLQELGLTLPLDSIGLQKLGRNRGVDAVVTGEVASVSFSSSPRQATVSLIFRATDTVTGELINGAIAQGTSNARAISAGDDDALVNQAIDNAAFAAVKQISQFNLPFATVLNSRDEGTVLLNRGTSDGLRDGMNMVVTRAGQEVGRIRIARASSDQSDATVTVRGVGIRPEDKAVAIYELPAYNITNGTLRTNSSNIASDGVRSNGGKRNAFSGVGGILLAVLAAALLISLVKRGGGGGSGTSLGGAAVGKPIAEANRSEIIGGGGTLNTQFFGFFGLDIIPADYEPVSVRITATQGNITTPNFQEYHVYRSDNPTFLNSGVNFGIGGTTSTTVDLARFGQFPLLTQTGRGNLRVFDDVNPKFNYGASKPDPLNSSTLQVLALVGVVPGTGLIVGNRYQYSIEALYIQPATTGGSGQNPGTGNTGGGNTGGGNTGGGGGGGNTAGGGGGGGGNTGGGGGGNTGGGGSSGHGQTFQLTGRRQTNFITYIQPVKLVPATGTPGLPTVNVTGLNNINTSNVRSTRGADDYILEVSSDLGFRNKRVFRPSSTGPYTAPIAKPREGPPLQFNIQNNTDLQNTFRNVSTLFFRIGARDSRNGSGTEGAPNPYIYSDPVAENVASGGATGQAVLRKR